MKSEKNQETRKIKPNTRQEARGLHEWTRRLMTVASCCLAEISSEYHVRAVDWVMKVRRRVNTTRRIDRFKAHRSHLSSSSGN